MNNIHPTPMRNARRWMMCLALMLCAAIHAQNKIEYFWNTDPGIGKGTKVAVANGMVNFDLDTDALPADKFPFTSSHNISQPPAAPQKSEPAAVKNSSAKSSNIFRRKLKTYSPATVLTRKRSSRQARSLA